MYSFLFNIRLCVQRLAPLTQLIALLVLVTGSTAQAVVPATSRMDEQAFPTLMLTSRSGIIKETTQPQAARFQKTAHPLPRRLEEVMQQIRAESVDPSEQILFARDILERATQPARRSVSSASHTGASVMARAERKGPLQQQQQPQSAAILQIFPDRRSHNTHLQLPGLYRDVSATAHLARAEAALAEDLGKAMLHSRGFWRGVGKFIQGGLSEVLNERPTAAEVASHPHHNHR